MDYLFWLWLGAAVMLSVAEIFTAGFFLLPFGIGAAFAAAVTYFGATLGWQIATFIGVSAVAFFALHRFADHMTHEPPQKVAGDRLVGTEGVVIEQIDNHVNTGRVRVQREEWVADSADDAILAVGTKVLVTGVVGAHLVVEPSETPAGSAGEGTPPTNVADSAL